MHYILMTSNGTTSIRIISYNQDIFSNSLHPDNNTLGNKECHGIYVSVGGPYIYTHTYAHSNMTNFIKTRKI